MLKLRSGAPSPFGRKVKIAAALLGIDLEVIATDTNDANDPLRKDNPLGKIPALIREDGGAVYDSRVILEYLDLKAGGGRIIPREPGARIEVLTLQALADGIMDAALLQVYEGRWRAADRQDAKWLEHQAGKVTRGLAVLESAPPALPKDASGLDVGHIAVACALGYLDLRFAGTWRATHPKLVAWLDAFAALTPAFAKTKVT